MTNLFKGSDLSSSGFTLFELIVVLIIISLISAFALPNFSKSLTKLNLDTAVNRLCATFRYARNKATSERKVYIVLLDLDNDRLAIGNRDPAESESENEINWDTQKIYKLPEGVQFVMAKSSKKDETVTTGHYMIKFFPQGRSSGAEIQLKNEKEKLKRIEVDFITGLVKRL